MNEEFCILLDNFISELLQEGVFEKEKRVDAAKRKLIKFVDDLMAKYEPLVPLSECMIIPTSDYERLLNQKEFAVSSLCKYRRETLEMIDNLSESLRIYGHKVCGNELSWKKTYREIGNTPRSSKGN